MSCFEALCGRSSTYPNGIQCVIQLFPLFYLLLFHVETIIVDTKVEIHLHKAKVILPIVQAQLVETCREKWRFLLPEVFQDSAAPST